MKTRLLTLALITATIALIPPVADASGLPIEVSSAAEALDRLDENATVRLVNVWATWCAPCVAEMNELEELHRTYHGKGLEIVGISMDDVIPGDRNAAKEKVARFLADRSISFTNVYFTGKSSVIMDELEFEGEIPITILYGPNGGEIMRIQGPIIRANLEKKLREILKMRN